MTFDLHPPRCCDVFVTQWKLSARLLPSISVEVVPPIRPATESISSALGPACSAEEFGSSGFTTKNNVTVASCCVVVLACQPRLGTELLSFVLLLPGDRSSRLVSLYPKFVFFLFLMQSVKIRKRFIFQNWWFGGSSNLMRHSPTWHQVQLQGSWFMRLSDSLDSNSSALTGSQATFASWFGFFSSCLLCVWLNSRSHSWSGSMLARPFLQLCAQPSLCPHCRVSGSSAFVTRVPTKLFACSFK